MSNYHHHTNPSYMIYGSSLDPISSPTIFPFDDTISMAHSQSVQSYGSSPESCRDSYIDNRYLQTAAAASASPTFSAPLSFEDPFLYTSTYDDNPVRPTDIDPRDLEYSLMDTTSWRIDSEASSGRSRGGSSTMAPTSYEPQPVYDLSAGEKGNYSCPKKGCTSEVRFSRKTDLARHVASVHGGKRIDCDYKWCGRYGDNGFTRRDHLREHLRKVHQLPIPKEGKGGKRH